VAIEVHDGSLKDELQKMLDDPDASILYVVYGNRSTDSITALIHGGIRFAEFAQVLREVADQYEKRANELQ
jgi:hypothetical protein